jgi:hypothetical protein
VSLGDCIYEFRKLYLRVWEILFGEPGSINMPRLHSQLEQPRPGLAARVCSAVQCSAVQCSAVQGSAVQCNAVQGSVVQCSAVHLLEGKAHQQVALVLQTVVEDDLQCNNSLLCSAVQCSAV